IITSTGGVGGTGVTAHALAAVDNRGTVNASGFSTGVSLLAGGLVINERGGAITGSIGIDMRAAGNVFNDGVITSNSGYRPAIYLENGGTVTNGGYSNRTALIANGAVYIKGGAGAVLNFATIAGGGVQQLGGGSVVNGGGGDTTAAIEGYGVLVGGASGTVSNHGLIAGGAYGVEMDAGGEITNGAATDTTARIQAATGVDIYGAATMTNFGVIRGTRGQYGGYGALFNDGVSLTNGTAIDRTALIEGYAGVVVRGDVATVANFGTLRGDGVAEGEQGLFLGAGGTVTNGGAGDADALIEGAAGVRSAGVATVTNFGEIEGHFAEGIDLSGGGNLVNLGAIHGATVGVEVNGGEVTNGGGAVRSAVITGYGTGVLGLGDTRVDNSGTIMATGRAGAVGVDLTAGGGVVNGSGGDDGALISGDTGVSLTGSGAFVDNYGTILGLGDFSGFGVVLHGGETASNILAGSRIEGPVGVAAYGGGNTVFNAGTIIGNGTWAVRLTDATDQLDVAAGAAFIGTVEGGGGTLGLTSGVGTLSGLMAGGAVTVTGSMAATTFHDFDTLIVGGTFRSLGDVSVAAGQTLEAIGSLTLGGGKAKVVNAGLIEAEGPGLLTIKGAIQNTGTLAVLLGTITVTGAVTGAGVAHIDSGRLDFMASFTEDVTFTG
ncbi:MAG: hypothetical protein ABI906_10020, partial [Pseudomonadota bacterium]